MICKFSETIQWIENKITEYYQLDLVCSVENFLMNKDQIKSFHFDTKIQPERASILLDQQNEEMFIGMYVCEQLVDKIKSFEPLKKLNNQSIDAFAVLIEEISHFHLIINRATAKRSISKLELEWQGEIDKFLFSNLLLEEQYGDCHLIPLSKLMFDQSILITTETNLYEEVNKLAARFCYDISNRFSNVKNFLQDPNFRQHMIKNYHAPLTEKKMYDKSNQAIIAA